jgi:spermidine/putrescine transport system permease protein
MATAAAAPPEQMKIGINPMLRLAAFLSLGMAMFWALMFVRWSTFSVFDWRPWAVELRLAEWPANIGYLLYGLLFAANLLIAIGLLREAPPARLVAVLLSAALLLAGSLYYWLSRDFYFAAFVVGLSGFILVLLSRSTVGALAYPAGFWLLIFFIIPNIIVLIVSLGERSRLGTVTYPPFSLDNLGVYFNDYARFFSRIGGEFVYLRIFLRSAVLAMLNTVICLAFGYPFAYWIARQPRRYRNMLVFLVMIPFWTNFLVRTYAWILILRDSGLINNFWTITLHDQAAALADGSAFFTWLAGITANKLPLLFNTPAVLVGLFYGYLPFMILPLYANLERMDWSLLEAAADLGAGRWRSITRVLIPLTMPGIAAGLVIVFIPSLGAYVTPDLMGGAKVSLVGNLLQQQFMTVRDWPFGSAIGFILMAIMLVAVLFYFRVSEDNRAL